MTDEAEVRRILEGIALNDPNVRIHSEAEADRLELIRNGKTETYLLSKLYIADGVLKHRDWLLNSNLGSIAYVAPEEPESPASK